MMSPQLVDGQRVWVGERDSRPGETEHEGVLVLAVPAELLSRAGTVASNFGFG
jgi:hypothetical protein